MFSPPLIQDMANVWVTLFNVFWSWVRDRIQTIPFKVIPEASRGPQYRGSLIEDVTSYFYFSEARIVGGGGGTPKIKTVQRY